MKAGALLSLLLCFVAVSQGRDVLQNSQMNGCEVGNGNPVPSWTGSLGSVSQDTIALIVDLPAGDPCTALFNSDPSLFNTISQTITVPATGSYDFSGAVACLRGPRGQGCQYSLSIDGQDVLLTDSFSAATSPTIYRPVTAPGIILVAGTYDLVFAVTFTSSSLQAFLTSLSLVPTGGGSGDPHMVGFQGQRFDFIGQPGQIINLLTDPDLQINTLLDLQKNGENSFIPGPVMMEMAFMTRGHTVMINAGGYQKDEIGFVSVDGVLLPLGHSFLDGILSVVFTPLNTNSRHLGLTGNDHIVAQVDVKLEGLFEFRVFMIENGKDNLHHSKWVTNYSRRFLDFNASLLDQDRRPHGILGQTAAPLSKERSVGEWTIEGKDQDYVVKDGITGTQFAFNQF